MQLIPISDPRQKCCSPLLILQPGGLLLNAEDHIPRGCGALLPFTAACSAPPGRPRPCSACMKSGLERGPMDAACPARGLRPSQMRRVLEEPQGSFASSSLGDAMGCSRKQPSGPCPLRMPCSQCQDSCQPSVTPVPEARLCPVRGEPPAPCSHLSRSALNISYCFTFCSLLGHKGQSCQFARSDPWCPTNLTPSLKRQKSHCLAPPSV